MYHRRHQCLAFTDDIAIITSSKRELQHVNVRLEVSAQEVELEMNESKTRFMVHGRM